MGNKRTLTKPELLEIARAIATGGNMIEIAGAVGVDRTTLSGWIKNDTFLGTIASAMPSPAVLGADVLERLRDWQYHDGERESARNLRIRLWQAVRRTFPAYFENDERDAERNRQCAQADQLYTVEALTILEDRGWKCGTADERARGLTTARKRKAYRLRHGLKWDWNDGLGCYFNERWDATRCAVRYADEDGMSDEDQRQRYGYSERDADSHAREELIETNTLPLSTNRDPRLPTTPDEARAFLEAVKGDADFADALPVRRKC